MTEEEILALAAEFSRRISLDLEMRSMMRKVQKKTADFGDTSQMFLRRAELLRNYLQGIVTDLPEGAREQLCTALLNEGYTETNEVMKSVQTALDEPQGIHLNPVQPKRPDERIAQVAHSLEDPTVPPEKIVRRAGAPVANVSMSFHDDFIRENAETRGKLGLNPVISRYGTDCCEWCSAVAGRYEYGEQPKDIFRRHDNCDCTIVYDTKVLRGKTSADGRRSRTWEEMKPEEVLAAAPEPKVFTKEQAEILQENAASRLTLAGERDIIYSADANADKQARWLYDAMTPQERAEVVMRGIREPDPTFSYDRPDNKAMSSLKKAAPEPNTFDVRSHGNYSCIEFFKQDYPKNDRRASIDAYTLATILRGRDDFKAFVSDCISRGVEPVVRLMSCSTGDTTNTGNCFAQLLANELGIKVIAPTDILYTEANGEIYVGDYHDGDFRDFIGRK